MPGNDLSEGDRADDVAAAVVRDPHANPRSAQPVDVEGVPALWRRGRGELVEVLLEEGEQADVVEVGADDDRHRTIKPLLDAARST
ncbi:hypothetical protein [Agilicoccus flavus]|uniref:hypothetical protein n=1 Tax=Agilicoccus flavus TaxID=2775968 RepID=UPI001CF70EE5|nr:hypothetical protein [Agilicoccus flavus]